MLLPVIAGLLLGIAGIFLKVPAGAYLLIAIALALLRWPALGVALLAFVLPMRWVGAVDVGFRLTAAYVVLAIALMAFFAQHGFRLPRIRTPIDIPLALLILVALLSAFQSRLIPADAPVLLGALRNVPWLKSLSRIFLLLGMTGICYYTAFMINSKLRLKLALTALTIGAVAFSLWGIYGFAAHYAAAPSALQGWRPYYTELFSDRIEPPRIRGPEDEPLFFAAYLLALLPMTLALLVARSRLVDRRLLWTAVPVLMAALLLTFSRSGLIGLIVALAVLFIAPLAALPRRAILRGGAAVACLAAIGLAIFANAAPAAFDMYIGQHFNNPFDDSNSKSVSAQVRLYQGGLAIGMFHAHPLLGVGFENYNFHAGLRLYPGVRAYPINFEEPNNLYLKFLAEMGVLGFAALLAVVVVLVRSLWLAASGARDADIQTVLAGILASLAGFAVIFMFSSTLHLPYLWFLLGLGLAAHRLAGYTRAHPA